MKTLSLKQNPAYTITLIYLLSGVSWILWSDTIVYQLAGHDHTFLIKLQNIKGITYVIVSGFILFVVSHHLYKRLLKSNNQKQSLQQKVEALNKTNPDGLIDINFKNNHVDMNEKMRFYVSAKTNKNQTLTQHLLSRIHQDDQDRVFTEFTAAIKSNARMLTAEFKLQGTDQKYYSVISTMYFIRDKEGIIQRMIGEIRDVSQLRNLQAEYYNQQIKHKNRLATIIIKAQENERNRWAEELHDNISQMLTVVNLYLENTKVEKEKNITMIEQAKKIITEAQQEIRLLSSSIKPPSFHSTTLEQSVRRLIEDIKRIKKLELNFTEDPFMETLLSDDQKLMSYRAIQEQLNNIIKYAEASKIEITISKNAQTAIINVMDNGKGFDTGKISSGLGFRNIQSRLQLHNGNMQIESSPGSGCNLTVSFDL